jgi:hypothetical protein
MRKIYINQYVDFASGRPTVRYVKRFDSPMVMRGGHKQTGGEHVGALALRFRSRREGWASNRLNRDLRLCRADTRPTFRS